MSLVPTQHYIHEDSDSDWDEGVEIGVAEHHLSMERIIMKLERGLNTALNACLRGPQQPKFHEMDRFQRMREYRPTELNLPKTESGLPICGTVGAPRRMPRYSAGTNYDSGFYS